MSLHFQQNFRHKITYGYDHLVGYFIRVFERKRMKDPDEGIVININNKENGLMPKQMAEIAERYGFKIGVPEETINLE